METNELQPGQAENLPPPVEKSKNTLWIVLAICAFGVCICGPILAAVLFPIFAQYRQSERTTLTVSHAKQHSLGIIMYADDWDDKAPHSDWCDSIAPYTKNETIFTSVYKESRASEVRYDFALTATLLGKSFGDIEDVSISILTFESMDNKKNQVGGPELLPMPGRFKSSGKGTGSYVSFADGHIRFVVDSEFPSGFDDKGMFRLPKIRSNQSK